MYTLMKRLLNILLSRRQWTLTLYLTTPPPPTAPPSSEKDKNKLILDDFWVVVLQKIIIATIIVNLYDYWLGKKTFSVNLQTWIV